MVFGESSGEQAEVGMTYDVEEEISVAALVAELIFRQRPERDARTVQRVWH
jgi:hypothetical protein